MQSFHHIHLKSTEPHETAAWYVERFGAKIVRDMQTMVILELPGSGPKLGISTSTQGEVLPPGSADPHLGLEHFGLQTDDLDGRLAKVLSFWDLRGLWTANEWEKL